MNSVQFSAVNPQFGRQRAQFSGQSSRQSNAGPKFGFCGVETVAGGCGIGALAIGAVVAGVFFLGRKVCCFF